MVKYSRKEKHGFWTNEVHTFLTQSFHSYATDNNVANFLADLDDGVDNSKIWLQQEDAGGNIMAEALQLNAYSLTSVALLTDPVAQSNLPLKKSLAHALNSGGGCTTVCSDGQSFKDKMAAAQQQRQQQKQQPNTALDAMVSAKIAHSKHFHQNKLSSEPLHRKKSKSPMLPSGEAVSVCSAAAGGGNVMGTLNTAFHPAIATEEGRYIASMPPYESMPPLTLSSTIGPAMIPTPQYQTPLAQWTKSKFGAAMEETFKQVQIRILGKKNEKTQSEKQVYKLIQSRMEPQISDAAETVRLLHDQGDTDVNTILEQLADLHGD